MIPPRKGMLLGAYVLREKAGTGMMGDVWRARHIPFIDIGRKMRALDESVREYLVELGIDITAKKLLSEEDQKKIDDWVDAGVQLFNAEQPNWLEISDRIGHGEYRKYQRVIERAFKENEADIADVGERLFTYAVKVVAPKFAQAEEKLDEMVERFLREITIMKQLNHEHICKVLEGGVHHGWYYAVMEHVPGKRLDERTLAIAEAARVLESTMEAITHAHSTGILHRDIKPSNILVTDDFKKIKVTDFGIAKGFASETTGGSLANPNMTDHTSTGGMVGTPGYAAPELLRGEKATPASDAYAIGATAYFLLTGRPPSRPPSGEGGIQAIFVQTLNDDLWIRQKISYYAHEGKSIESVFPDKIPALQGKRIRTLSQEEFDALAKKEMQRLEPELPKSQAHAKKHASEDELRGKAMAAIVQENEILRVVTPRNTQASEELEDLIFRLCDRDRNTRIPLDRALAELQRLVREDLLMYKQPAEERKREIAEDIRELKGTIRKRKKKAARLGREAARAELRELYEKYEALVNLLPRDEKGANARIDALEDALQFHTGVFKSAAAPRELQDRIDWLTRLLAWEYKRLNYNAFDRGVKKHKPIGKGVMVGGSIAVVAGLALFGGWHVYKAIDRNIRRAGVEEALQQARQALRDQDYATVDRLLEGVVADVDELPDLRDAVKEAKKAVQDARAYDRAVQLREDALSALKQEDFAGAERSLAKAVLLAEQLSPDGKTRGIAHGELRKNLDAAQEYARHFQTYAQARRKYAEVQKHLDERKYSFAKEGIDSIKANLATIPDPRPSDLSPLVDGLQLLVRQAEKQYDEWSADLAVYTQLTKLFDDAKTRVGQLEQELDDGKFFARTEIDVLEQKLNDIWSKMFIVNPDAPGREEFQKTVGSVGSLRDKKLNELRKQLDEKQLAYLNRSAQELEELLVIPDEMSTDAPEKLAKAKSLLDEAKKMYGNIGSSPELDIVRATLQLREGRYGEYAAKVLPYQELVRKADEGDRTALQELLKAYVGEDRLGIAQKRLDAVQDKKGLEDYAVILSGLPKLEKGDATVLPDIVAAYQRLGFGEKAKAIEQKYAQKEPPKDNK